MRVVHLSSSDVIGGAARGSYALHRELLGLGVDSHMLVARKTTDDPTVHSDDSRLGDIRRHTSHHIDQFALRAYQSRDRTIFSPALGPSRVTSQARALKPDIIHLHWVAESFVLPEHLPRFGRPIVWTLRDMWPITGGCHYAGYCERFTERCGACPKLGSRREVDLSRLLWWRKQRSWAGVDIVPVGISPWIAEQARRSSLFGGRAVRVISNGVDVSFWKRVDPLVVRQSLGIPAGAKIVLFVTLDLGEKRKGFADYRKMCRLLANRSAGYHALVVGGGQIMGSSDLALPSTFTGPIDDDSRLREAYSASDVTVVPSKADAFGKTVAESLACGTPCVVYSETGPAGIISDRANGYIAPIGHPEELANGAAWVTEHAERWQKLSHASRRSSVERFSLRAQGLAYRDLYSEIVGHR